MTSYPFYLQGKAIIIRSKIPKQGQGWFGFSSGQETKLLLGRAKRNFSTQNTLTLRLRGSLGEGSSSDSFFLSLSPLSRGHTSILGVKGRVSMTTDSQPSALFSVLYYLSKQTFVHISIRINQTHIMVTAC